MNTESTSWFRRIYKEIKDYNYEVEKDVFTLYYNEKKYTLDVGCYYPFRPPNLIMSNDKIISYNPNLYPIRLWDAYQEKTGKCMCCSNMLCADNWSPARRIIHAINEYENFIENLKTIQKIRIFKNVQLPDDMIYYILDFIE